MHYPKKTLNKIKHRNLAAVYENWTEELPEGSLFPEFSKFLETSKLALSAQEPVDGVNLSDWLETEAYKKLDARVDVVKQICETIEYLHSKDIVHGNLWPKTIFVTQSKNGPNAETVVKLVTFGWNTVHEYSAPESVSLFS